LTFDRKYIRENEQLSQSEANLQEAHAIARMGRWELDLAANRLFWSEGIYNIFEVSPDNFAASYEAFLGFIHPEDRELVDQAYSQSVKDKTPYEVTHRLLMPDGRTKWVNEIGRTEYDPHGRPVRSYGTVKDITIHKRAEQILYEEKELLRVTLRSIGDAVITTDKYGTVTNMQ
jgi:PAS domain S-box-containing protein